MDLVENFRLEYFLLVEFFITITHRDITKQTDQYLSKKINNSMI